MSRKPRLAVCISRYEYGGQGTVVEEELRHLAGDFALTLITEKIDRPVPTGIDAIEIPAWSRFPLVNRHLTVALRSFDVVHCHDSLGFMSAAAASGRRYVVTCHGIAPLR